MKIQIDSENGIEKIIAEIEKIYSERQKPKPLPAVWQNGGL